MDIFQHKMNIKAEVSHTPHFIYQLCSTTIKYLESNELVEFVRSTLYYIDFIYKKNCHSVSGTERHHNIFYAEHPLSFMTFNSLNIT